MYVEDVGADDRVEERPEELAAVEVASAVATGVDETRRGVHALFCAYVPERAPGRALCTYIHLYFVRTDKLCSRAMATCSCIMWLVEGEGWASAISRRVSAEGIQAGDPAAVPATANSPGHRRC